MGPDISILILVSKVSNRLRECIDSIEKYTNLPHEIILLYSDTTEQSLDCLQKFSNTRYLPCPNMNTAMAYNSGIKEAQSENILILSPRATVKPHWDRDIIDCSNIIPSIGLVGRPKKAIRTEALESLDFYIAESLDEDCLLIKKTVTDSIGYFDDEFSTSSFMFDDFFLRARQSGFELFYCNEDYFTMPSDDTPMDNIDYLDIYIDNRDRFIDKWQGQLPIKNDLIGEILNKIPPMGKGNVLFLGDDLIIPNTLCRRGYKVHSLPRTKGYSDFLNQASLYNIIILFDNITHEETLIRLLKSGKATLESRGLMVANVQNSLYIERVQQVFKGNFSIAAFDPSLKYPLSCLSKPEIMVAGEVANLELMYLVGFAAKPNPEFQQIFKEIYSTDPGNSSFKEELCIEEYLAVWQKNQSRD